MEKGRKGRVKREEGMLSYRTEIPGESIELKDRPSSSQLVAIMSSSSF